MQVSDWVTHIAERLSDYRKDNPAALNHRHWSKELIQSFYNSAYTAIANANPEDFATEKVVRLKAGTSQKNACDMVGQVTQYVDKDGNYLGTLRPISRRPSFSLGCSDVFNYRPRESFAVSATEFEIYPPVPDNCAFYVKIKCIDLTPPANGSVPAKYQSVITEWAMFSALSGETDTTIIPLAQLHYKAFYDLLGLQRKSDEAFRMKVKANDA
jgi:hypothetical protein